MEDELESSFVFTWSIENFNSIPLIESFESPRFQVKALYNTKWSLVLDPIEKLVTIRLKRSENELTLIESNLSLVTTDHSTIANESPYMEVPEDEVFTTIILDLDVLLRNKTVYLPDDALTVRCCIYLQPMPGYFTSKYCGPNHCSARTRFQCEHRVIEWTISQFSRFDKISVPVVSALKKHPALTLTYFTHPKQDNLLCCCLKLGIESQVDSYYVFYRQTAINAEIRRNATAEGRHLFQGLHSSYYPYLSDSLQRGTDYIDAHHATWAFPHVFKKGMLLKPGYGYVVNDTLKLRSEFLIYANPAEPISEITSQYVRSRKLHVHKLLNTEDSLEDVSLRVGDRVISAHRAVLSAHSPVFRAMFLNDMKEKKTGVVVIEDINPDTVERMVGLIYEGSMESLSIEEVVDLLCAAHKYEAREVMDSCMSFLGRKLSLENVLVVLGLSDSYHLAELKKYVVNFIYAHSREVLDSEEWNGMLQSNVVLAGEVLHAMWVRKVTPRKCLLPATLL